MNIRLKIRKILWIATSTLLVSFPGLAKSALLDLSDIPLEVREGVPPNIILTMDDSGSMAWGFLPDDRDDGSLEVTHRFKSATFNRMYYDPNITYLPGVDENGATLPNATFTSAWHHGYIPTIGTVDLSTNYRMTAQDYRGTFNHVHYVGENGPESTNINNVPGVPAYYYVFDTTRLFNGTETCDINNTNHVLSSDDCYSRVIVSSTSGVNRYSPEVTGCVPADPSNSACYTGPDERQNFANWYSYYRLRHLLAKTATTRAFAGLGNNVRVAWQTLNAFQTINNPLPFEGTHRTDFFNWIYTAPTDGGTPLTNATWRAGEKSQNPAVYRKDPNDTTSPQYSCRQNFHFAFTDGYWNSNGVTTPGNYDGSDIPNLPTTSNSPYGDINYEATTSLQQDKTPPIYRDENSNYLGDIAFYFWARDLMPGLTNNVPIFVGDNSTDIDGDSDVDNNDLFWNPLNDPADWQHMVNFTVGLGVSGQLNNDAATYQALMKGPNGGGIDWPGCGNSQPCKVDDLWHAAINSRGRFFSARSPSQLISGFQSVINAIVERKGSASAVATTSSRYEVGTNLFQAIYDPNDWSGDILAKDVVNNTTLWSAANVLKQFIDNGNQRTIITFDGSTGTGTPFQWSNLNAAQQSALNTLNGVNDGKGQDRLDWLRGDDSNEQQNGGTLRNRSNYLGDITHSDPVFVPPPGPPLFFYPDNLESVAYSTYINSNSSRPDMLLFGANDGMLHILNADTGQELMAYVPNILFNKLGELTDPGYNHQYYIDRTIGVWDVFFGGSWHTVAIGGLGKGGQGIYALDISSGNFSEGNASSIAMWEFTDADDRDLGYTYTTPYMMKMNNGKWMVAFGNGHNNTEADGNASLTGDAILFLLDIETGGKSGSGTKIKLSTGVGTADDPLGLGRPNALADIVAIDTNQDYKVDYIYAGDYFGNLWKFDVSDADPNNWSVWRDSSNNPTPLFVARSPSGEPQPITFAPVIQAHTKKKGYLVYVGTGSYIQTGDVSDNTVQSIYGIWDRFESNINTITRDYLLEQSLLEINTNQFTETNARGSTANIMRWYDGVGLPSPGLNPKQYLGWRMDLLNNGAAEGERLFDNLDIAGNVLSFTTIIPSLDPCVSGGESWAFRINADTGSRFLTSSPWDYNNDGTIGSSDEVNFASASYWGSGIQGKDKSLFRSRTLIVPGTCKEANVQSLADGTIRVVTSACTTKQIGRRSWRQLEIK